VNSPTLCLKRGLGRKAPGKSRSDLSEKKRKTEIGTCKRRGKKSLPSLRGNQILFVRTRRQVGRSEWPEGDGESGVETFGHGNKGADKNSQLNLLSRGRRRKKEGLVLKIKNQRTRDRVATAVKGQERVPSRLKGSWKRIKTGGLAGRSRS